MLGINNQQARYVLEKNNWVVETAINNYFNNPD